MAKAKGIPRKHLIALQKRNISFLHDKVQSPTFKEEIFSIIEQYRIWLLKQQINTMVEAGKIKDLMKLFFAGETLERVFQNVVKPALINELKELNDSHEHVSHYLPAHSQEIIGKLLDSPHLLPPKWLKKSFEHKAFHQLMASLLYNALKEFTLQVNPFFSSWGLPALLKKAAPFGLDPFGVGGKVIDTVKNEFEKQLEPQIKQFLSIFTGTGLQHVYGFMTSPGNSQIFIDLKKDMFLKIKDEEVSSFTNGLKEPRTTQLSEVVCTTIIHYLRLESTHLLIEKEIDIFFEKQGKMTIEDFFTAYDIDSQRWSGEVLEMLWPSLAKYFQSREFHSVLDNMVNEFYDNELLLTQKGEVE